MNARNAVTITTAFLWKSTGAVLVAFSIGVVFALGARGMVEAGLPNILLWLGGIAAFFAFAGGLCFWAMHVAKSGTAPATSIADETTAEAEPAPACPVGETVEVPPGKVISFEDDSDRAYREFLELNRPDIGGAR